MSASTYRAAASTSGLDVDRRLRCRAIVAVVEPAHLRRCDDAAGRRRHDLARDRRVLLKCQMRSRLHVVGDVSGEHLAQPRRVHDDDMVEALTSDRPITRSAYAFCHGDRGAVRTAWIFIPAVVVATSAKTASRSCRRYAGGASSGKALRSCWAV